MFESLVRLDERFEIVGKVTLGLVCFRLKGSNDLNVSLLNMITKDGRVFMVPSQTNSVYYLRFAICSPISKEHHIREDWKTILEITDKMFDSIHDCLHN